MIPTDKQRSLLLAIAGVLAGLLLYFAFDRTTFLLALTVGGDGSAGSTHVGAIVGIFAGSVYGLFLGVANSMTVRGAVRRSAAVLIPVALGALAGAVAMRIIPIFPTVPAISLADGSAVAAYHIERTSVPSSLVVTGAAWALLGGAIGFSIAVVRVSGLAVARAAVAAATGMALAGLITARHGGGADGSTVAFGYALAGFGAGLLSSVAFGRKRVQVSVPFTAKAERNATDAEKLALDSVDQHAVDPSMSQVPSTDQRGVFDASELLGVVAYLRCIAGPYAGQRYLIPVGKDVVIGRGADQDIVLEEDTAASRAHASIWLREGRHVVVDNGSANGTFLNEAVVTLSPRRLFRGDIIRIGRTELQYEPDEK